MIKKSNLILTFSCAFLMISSLYASFPVTPKQDKDPVLTEVANAVEVNEQSFFSEIKEMATSIAPDIEWGAFALGALFGLLGVIAVFVFGGDTKSAWRGFFAWVLFLVALGLFV